jgi:hypothetical protein
MKQRLFRLNYLNIYRQNGKITTFAAAQNHFNKIHLSEVTHIIAKQVYMFLALVCNQLNSVK